MGIANSLNTNFPIDLGGDLSTEASLVLSGAFDATFTFTADPGAACVVNYEAYVVGQ